MAAQHRGALPSIAGSNRTLLTHARAKEIVAKRSSKMLKRQLVLVKL